MANEIIIGGTIAAAFTGLSYWNYRKFMPKSRSMGEKCYKVETRKLPIRMKKHTIYGELLRPAEKAGALPTVICCHGFGSSYKLCKNTIGMCLAKSGYQVYCFDFYGGSKHSRSGGSMLEMSIFTEQQDLNAVIDYIYDRAEVDKEHLYLMGESQGGCVAGITAPKHEQQIKAMVLYYPAFCIPDDARKRYSSEKDIPETDRISGKTVGRVYSENLLNYDVYKEICQFMKPVLILHGDADTVVNIEWGERAAQVYPHAVFKRYTGEIHGFKAKGKLQAAKDTYQFLEEMI